MKLQFVGLGLAIAALLVLGTIGRSASFSLKNPGFENGLASWLGGERFEDEVAIHAGNGRSGERCLRISMGPMSTTLPGVHQRLINLEPGATYRFSAWARPVEGKPATSVKLKLDFYNTRGENTSVIPAVKAVSEPGLWTPVEVTGVADSDAALVDAIVMVTGAGSVEIDDFRFEKIADPPGLRVSSSAPLAVEADSSSTVLLKASFKEPYPGKEEPQFRISNEGKPVAASFAVHRLDARNFSLAMQFPPLAPGSHRFMLSCGELDSAEPIRLEVPPRSRQPAFLGTGGEHRRAEQLFFPIGIYNVEHTEKEYAALAAHGFNMIQGKFPGNIDDFMASLDLALRHQIAVDVPLYAGGGVKANVGKSLELIRRAGRHPAVLCWKIFDEPDADQHIAVREEIPAVYAALKTAKPLQPLELTLCQEDVFSYWTRFCDVVQVDRYPLPGGSISEVYDFCVKAKAAMQPWQNLTFVLQCGWTQDLKTQPTAEQARAMVYLALIGGARGISWYSKREETGWDLTTTPLWPEMAAINAEIRSLAKPLLLGRKVEVHSDAEEIRHSGYLLEEKLYLLLCNPGDQAVEATVTLPEASAPEREVAARALSGRSREWAVEEGRVRVLLKPVESLTMMTDLAAKDGKGKAR